MKTLKLALVATLVAFVMVNVASADGIKEKPKFTKRVNISIENAVQNTGLAIAMHEQISPTILNFPMPPITAEVKYNGAIYRISGSRLQWIRFFRMEGDLPVLSRDKVRETN